MVPGSDEVQPGESLGSEAQRAVEEVNKLADEVLAAEQEESPLARMQGHEVSPRKVVAKFYVDSVEKHSRRHYTHKRDDGSIDYDRPETVILTTIHMRPDSGTTPENREFWEASPAGKLELGVLLPDAADHFELDGSYYVTFERAPD